MKLIWKIFVRDARQANRNVIAVIVAMGLVIVPALYAWYNIAASWDPYGNTKALKVAVANVDKGYKSGLMPITINVGETVTSTLRANHDLDWQFVDRAKAIDGVNSGEYYAALIIPKSFSSDMMTLFSPKIKHAKLEYYLNEKINPIAPHITDQGATTVATTIDQTFVKTLASVALDLVSNVADYAQSPQMEQYVNNASSHIATMSSRLTGTASQMDSYANLLGAANSIIDSTDKLLGSTGSAAATTKKALKQTRQRRLQPRQGIVRSHRWRRYGIAAGRFILRHHCQANRCRFCRCGLTILTDIKQANRYAIQSGGSGRQLWKVCRRFTRSRQTSGFTARGRRYRCRSTERGCRPSHKGAAEHAASRHRVGRCGHAHSKRYCRCRYSASRSEITNRCRQTIDYSGFRHVQEHAETATEQSDLVHGRSDHAGKFRNRRACIDRKQRVRSFWRRFRQPDGHPVGLD